MIPFPRPFLRVALLAICLAAALPGPLALAKKDGSCASRFDLLAQRQELRERVSRRLGWKPKARLTHLSSISDVKLFKPGDETRARNAVAFTSFRIKGTTLETSLTRVKEKYRRKGLTELMLLEILSEHPEIDRIFVDGLQDTNLEVLDKALKKKKLRKAIQETPAFRRCKAVGFGDLVQCEDNPGKATPMWFGDKKYLFVEDEGGISFTVRRDRR